MPKTDTAAIVAANRTVAEWMGWPIDTSNPGPIKGIVVAVLDSAQWPIDTAPPIHVLLGPVVEWLREEHYTTTCEYYPCDPDPETWEWTVCISHPGPYDRGTRAAHPDLATALLMAVVGVIEG